MGTKATILSMTGAILLGVTAVALSQTQPSTPAQPKPQAPAMPSKGGPIVLGDSTTVTATVVAIDRADRVVALMGPAGNIFEFEVADAVKNFNNIRVGDKVKAEYYEAVAVYLGKPGTQPEEDAGAIVATAAPGKKPAIYAVGAVDESATVKAVDRTKRTVTLTGPMGNTFTVHVGEALSSFETINVGDSIHVRYIEGITIAVEKA